MRVLAFLSSFLITLFLVGCTVSVVDTHTESGSTESVTETQKTVPKVNGAINVPVQSPTSPQNITVPPKAAVK